MSFRSTFRSIIGNIKETFLPKTGIWKKQVLQDPRYVNKLQACCLLHAMMQGAILIVFTVYVDTVNTYIQLNYNVDSNTKSSSYMKIWLKALIYFELQQTSN